MHHHTHHAVSVTQQMASAQSPADLMTAEFILPNPGQCNPLSGSSTSTISLTKNDHERPRRDLEEDHGAITRPVASQPSLDGRLTKVFLCLASSGPHSALLPSTLRDPRSDLSLSVSSHSLSHLRTGTRVTTSPQSPRRLELQGTKDPSKSSDYLFNPNHLMPKPWSFLSICSLLHSAGLISQQSFHTALLQMKKRRLTHQMTCLGSGEYGIPSQSIHASQVIPFSPGPKDG